MESDSELGHRARSIPKLWSIISSNAVCIAHARSTIIEGKRGAHTHWSVMLFEYAAPVNRAPLMSTCPGRVPADSSAVNTIGKLAWPKNLVSGPLTFGGVDGCRLEKREEIEEPVSKHQVQPGYGDQFLRLERKEQT